MRTRLKIHLWGALRRRTVLALLPKALMYQSVHCGCCAPGS